MKYYSHVRQMVLRCTALAVLIACLFAAFLSSATSAAAGHTGQALAVRAALHPQQGQSNFPPVVAGRYAYNHSNWAGTQNSVLHANATAALVNPNNVNDQPVQTFDTFAPPSNNFVSTVGGFTTNNHNPVWSADGSYIVFSSNLAGDGHDHLFYVSANGGAPVQITRGNGNEEFPVLNASNSALAFTSTVNTPNVPNLYTLNFTPTAGQTPVDVSTLTSLTIRGDLTTGFSEVRHPTWSPGGDRIAFAAYSTGPNFNGNADPNKNHFHIYFLYVQTLGYDPTGQSSANPPGKLTDGPADDTDPSWSPDGRYIAFASNASALTNVSTIIDPTSTPPVVPTLTVSPLSNGARSIFLLSGGNPELEPFGTAVQTGTDGSGNPILGRVTIAGTDDYGPAWSFPAQSPNTDFFLNPNSDTEYLTFARSDIPADPHDIYYLNTYTFGPNGSGIVTPEDAAGNAAVKLDTDDNLNAISRRSNNYNDTYPSFAPFGTLFRITYSSNRTVTYNDTTTGNPVEVAQSAPSPSASGVVTTTYRGILQSEIINLNPPTLLRFSGSEVIHVNAGTASILPTTANPSGSATKNIQPTANVTFTVRLSSREAGIDNTGYTNGGPMVFLQIKDPDSTYQDSQKREHKVFTTDQQGLVNRLALGTQFGDSGTATSTLYNLGQRNVRNHVGTPLFTVRGSVGGRDGDNYLTVGHYSGALSSDPPGGTPNNAPTGANLTLDPFFMPQGQEYECQYVNPQFAANNTGDTGDGDYGTPYYLAGFDDVGAFAGATHPPRPTANGVDGNGVAIPAEWLQMTPLPAAQQDGKGGVLYTVSWKTPSSSSDYFLDVIAYDQAQFQGAKGNFRIYDNTGGFTTAPFTGSNDILVVSDNALGQKFAFNTTNNQTGQSNLKPTLYGAESYFTDVDPSLVPNCVYLVSSRPDDKKVTAVSSDVQGFEPSPASIADPLNGLGVNSFSTTPEQQYSLWRTLSRGAVPESILRAYSPTQESQPVVDDPITKFHSDPADGTVDANGNLVAGHKPKIPVATRCVVWVAPYVGDVLTDAGSLADTTTQAELRNFVRGGSTLPGGGRLYISGPDVAETLTLQGNANNGVGDFLNDVLNARYASSAGGSYNPAVTASVGHRILYDAYFNPTGNFKQPFRLPTSLTAGAYQAPGNSPSFLFSNSLGGGGARPPDFRTDASLDQFTPGFYSPIASPGTVSLGSIDTISLQNGAHTDLNFGGDSGIAYLENVSNGTNVPNGARTVYTSFGMEALGIEYYAYTDNGKKYFAARNIRPRVLHNIVDYLRTGSFTGFIRQGTTGGTGVGGVTVYLLSQDGSDIPGNSRNLRDPKSGQTYSAVTDISGQYTIHGVEPGGYYVVAYKTGFTRATTASVKAGYTVDGDTTTTVNLNITLLPPGGIKGKVIDGGGNPVPGATVSYTSSDGSQTFTTQSDTNGAYSIANVPAGTYAGKASKPPLYTDSALNSVTVTGGATTVAPDLILSLKGANISGRVYNIVSNNDVPGATVTLVNSNGKTVATTKTGTQTDTSANYTFTNVQIPITGGTYTLTAIATGFSSSTITVVLTPGGTFAGKNIALTPVTPPLPGTLGGLITDGYSGKPLGGVAVKIFSGTTLIQTVKTSDTASSPVAPGGDSQPLNYVFSNLDPGTYSVTAGKLGYAVQTIGLATVTVKAAAFTRDDLTGQNSFQPLHVFSAGLNFFSAPYDFGAAGLSFNYVFNQDYTATSVNPTNQGHIAVYNPQLLSYVLDPTPPADGFHLGQGYWARLKQAAAVRTPDINPASLTPGSPTVAVALHTGWNMIGVPNKNSVLVSSVTFANRAGGSPITFAEASSQGVFLVSGTLYSYTGSTTTPYAKVTVSSTLQPWQAYWIYAYVNTTILIPAG